MQQIAVTVFCGMVSPRLDTADEIWLYKIDNKTAHCYATHEVESEHPVLMAEFLKQKEMDAIICGGCPRYYLQVLLCFGFTVFPGLEGTPDQVIKRYISGSFPAPLEIEQITGCRCHQGRKQHRGNKKK